MTGLGSSLRSARRYKFVWAEMPQTQVALSANFPAVQMSKLHVCAAA